MKEQALSEKDLKIQPIQTLTQNYRTHSGVLDLAATIVQMLEELFPATIDHLPPENALVVGAKPMFLETTAVDSLMINLFGNGDASRYEFGAKQAILVRNKTTKRMLAQRISHGLVLTVEEAKGLEFDDVLIYDFFQDSDFEHWRVLIDLYPDVFSGQRGTRFDMNRHMSLCIELKSTILVCYTD
jgi:hypothetical protein